MPEKILFQQDRLTVKDAHLTVGTATVFYSSVSVASIYEGRPMLPQTIMASFGTIPLAFALFIGPRLLGSSFPAKLFVFMILIFLGLLVTGFLYQVKCLFITIDGRSVPVLKSKERLDLERAKAAIEEAKSALEGRSAR